ncbi:MAG: PilN domain-containing protein [Parcubacteria group bacterium]|jgi:Tfp pilus assembly protein PilN
MKIRLNLLPKSKEKKIKNKKILKFVILQEIMIILITVLFFGVVKGVDAIASFRLDSVNKQISSNGAKGDYVEIKKYENGLKDVRAKTYSISKIQKFSVAWAPVLDKLAQVLPSEITLTSIDGSGYNLLLKGVAQNRDILIKMKEDMQKNECFKNVVIPLNDIVLRENIEFELKLDINKECLNNYEKK